MKVCIAATLTCATVATLVSSGWWILKLHFQDRGSSAAASWSSSDEWEEGERSSDLTTAQTALPQFGLPFKDATSVQATSLASNLDSRINTSSVVPTLYARSSRAIHGASSVSLEPGASMREATQHATVWLQGLHVPRDFWFQSSIVLQVEQTSRDGAKMQPTTAARTLPPAMLANPNAVATRLLMHAQTTGDTWLCAAALTHARLHLPKGRACTEVLL